MANGVSVDLIVDPKKAISGLNDVESKAGGVADGLGKLGAAAAKGLAVLGAAALAAVTGLVAATKSAGEYAESVQLAASKTHLTTDAVQELKYAAKITGIDFETMTLSMTKLTKSMGAAQDGTGPAAEAFKALGVATTDANGNLRDSTVVYDEVIAALGEVENPAQRDVLAMQLLGKSATDLNGLIDGTAGSLSELAAQAHTAGAVMSEETLQSLADVDDALDGLSAGADAAKNALGLTLLPVLQTLGTEGTGLLGRFTNSILSANGDLSKAAPELGRVVSDAVTLILDQLPMLLEVGSSIITSILQGITLQAPKLIAQAIPVILNFVMGIVSMLPLLIDAGFKILVAVVQGVATALPTLIPQLVNTIISSLLTLVAPANLSAVLDAGLQLMTGLFKGALDALPTLIDALPKIITSIVTFLVDSIPTLIQAGIDLFLALVEALPEIIDGIVEAIPEIIDGVITAVIEAIPEIIQAGIDLLVALVEETPTIITEIIKAIPEIIKGLADAFTKPENLKKIGEAGAAILKGLWKGITDLGAWLWQQISGFFNHSIIDPIKQLFGIRSPSTLFAGFGRYMVLGLEKGLTAPNQLGSIMSDLSGQVTDGFEGSLSTSARATFTAAGGGAAAGGPVNIYVQSVSPGAQVGRDIVSAIQEYVRTGGTGLRAVLGG